MKGTFPREYTKTLFGWGNTNIRMTKILKLRFKKINQKASIWELYNQKSWTFFPLYHEAALTGCKHLLYIKVTKESTISTFYFCTNMSANLTFTFFSTSNPSNFPILQWLRSTSWKTTTLTTLNWIKLLRNRRSSQTTNINHTWNRIKSRFKMAESQIGK